MSKKSLTKELYPREYRIWKAMKSRCYANVYKNTTYQINHIEVCDRWKYSFDNFITDMGEAPSGYSIDRIDNNGNYCPQNCRWADNNTQSRNKSNNIFYNINGDWLCLKDIANKYNIKYTTLYNRIFRDNFSIEEAISPNFYEILKKRKQCSSIYYGVSFHIGKQKWQAYIQENGKQKFLGTYNTEEDAHNAIIAYDTNSSTNKKENK